MERIETIEERPHLLIPLEHGDVLAPRPPSHEYKAVRVRFRFDEPTIAATLDTIAPFFIHPNLDRVPYDPTTELEPHWNNGYFSGGDARAAYAMVAALRPKQVVEIGGGNSTKFLRRAAEDFQIPMRLTSIDPVPRADIDQLCDERLRVNLADAPMEVFDALGPGDILFHDGSHLTFNGSDTVQLFLEILPRLAAGVVIHLHDVTLPLEYPAGFDGRGYSEQYMLATTLLYSDAFEVMLPVNHLHAEGRLAGDGVSFWMRRR